MRDRRNPLVASDELKWKRKDTDGPLPHSVRVGGFTMNLQQEDRECASRLIVEDRCTDTRVVEHGAIGYVIVRCLLERNHPEKHDYEEPPDYQVCGHMVIDDTTYGQGTALECNLPLNHRGNHNYEELSEGDKALWSSLVSEQRQAEQVRNIDEERIRDAQATLILRQRDDADRQARREAAKSGVQILGRM